MALGGQGAGPGPSMPGAPGRPPASAVSTSSVQTRTQRRLPRHRASLPPGGGRRALGHRLRGSLNGIARADPAACPGRRYEQDQPAVRLEQNGGEPAVRGCTACTSQTSRSDARVTGQTGADRQSKRFRGPLLRPGCCPLYARNAQAPHRIAGVLISMAAGPLRVRRARGTQQEISTWAGEVAPPGLSSHRSGPSR